MPHAQQPRDGRAPARGTASLSGVVVSAESTAPVRRVRVEVGGTAVLTDDFGRFTFSRLQAGGYGILATKAGFLPAAYGARRVAGTGIVVDVRDGQHVGGLQVKLHRGSVLAGLVADQFARPAPNAEVRAFRYAFDADSGRRLPLPVTMGLASTVTDDQGRYRLYGLEPGEYIVSASSAPAASPARAIIEPDIRYAMQLLRLPPGAALDSGIRRPPPVAAPREGGGVPMFYPSADSVADATRVTLGLAEERFGVDIVRRRSPAGLVWGTISGPWTTIREGGKVHLIDSASPYSESVAWGKANGTFTFSAVPPGRYEVVAVPENGGLVGRSEAYVISGGEVALAPTLQPGANVTGRLVFQTATGQAADPALVRLSLVGASRADFPFRTSPSGSDGRFSWSNVPAGSYRLGVSTAANLQPGWRVKSAMVGDVDVLDGAVDVAAASGKEIVITLTDARSEISGTLQAQDGAPISDYSVLVFSGDSQFWRPVSRRTQIVRPSSSGRFALRDLPAGDYLIVALGDVEPGQWHSAEFLAELAPFAMKLSLADGEKKTQDIRIARR